MSGWRLGIAARLYASVGWDFLQAGRPGAFMAWTCYALANMGFIWDVLQGK